MYTNYDEIRLKLTAFFFNNKVDALRGEMYEALCLLALRNCEEPIPVDEVTRQICTMLYAKEDSFDGLNAIIIDVLNKLQESGRIECFDEKRYAISEKNCKEGQSDFGQETFLRTIEEEVTLIALKISPTLSNSDTKKIFLFYIEVTNLIAGKQLPFISQGIDIKPLSIDSQEIVTAVSECRVRYEVDKFIDVDKFINYSIVLPSEILADYLYKLYQVSIITNLLTWDPELEFLRNKVLANKTLYLDTSIIFSLVQKTHPLHRFITNLILASANDLKVKLRVHTSTIKEFNSVVIWNSADFDTHKKDLSDIAKICIRDQVSPADYLENSVYVDYLNENLDHIDLGSWQKYVSQISGESLIKLLTSYGILIDDNNIYVPDDIFWKIKQNMQRASDIHVQRRKRSQSKMDVDHDARIFHYLATKRIKTGGDYSLGYDKYLLTLDGSLVPFLREQGISWIDTYFLYPSQWYELSFPFLRIKLDNANTFKSAVSNMIFSPAFPALTSLIPLNLCIYVFNLGGRQLPMGSIQTIVSSLLEEKFAEKLNPENQDLRERQEAELKVERMIAGEEIRRRGEVEKLEREKQIIREQIVDTQNELERVKNNKSRIEGELAKKESELGRYGSTSKQVEAVRSVYLEEIEKNGLKIRELELKNLEDTEKLQGLIRETISEKETEITIRDSKIIDLSTEIIELKTEISILKEQYARNEEKKLLEEEHDREQKIQLKEKIRKTLISILLNIFAITIVIFLILLKAYLYVLLISFGLFVASILFFIFYEKKLISMLLYTLATIIGVAFIIEKVNSNYLFILIPLLIEAGIFYFDFMKSKKSLSI